MAQINPTVGDIRSNVRMIRRHADRAARLGCDLVLFPELAVTGYPPEDLVLKPRFIRDNLTALERLAEKIQGVTAVVGFVDRREGLLFNAAAIIHNGRVADVYHKMHLPNYGVFDEKRYFQAGHVALNFVIKGIRIGIEICEDIWQGDGPAAAQSWAGAEALVNINASPYHMGKPLVRRTMLGARAKENRVFIAYANTVGGQDELIFDGQSMVVAPDGEPISRGAAFDEELIITDLEFKDVPKKARRKKGVREIVLEPAPAAKGAQPRPPRPKAQEVTLEEEVLKGLVLGTHDYARKNGFRHAVIGLSGGIDSALVAAVAVKALGAGSITGVFMPSEYTSRESREDALALSKNLGIEVLTVPIKSTLKSYHRMLRKTFAGTTPDTTEENLQARVRGNILMAMSNKFGHLVLTTGNKSEMSVGYATLYGDMAGGFAVIKDVPKTLAYRLAAKINELEGRDIIPGRVLTKAPSAELKPDQTDQDTLPPYEVLDPILRAYIEDDMSFDEIAAMGFKMSTIRKVIRMVDRSEYKRRQAPPGIKITRRSFGKDRRMPITNGYDHGSFKS